MVPLHEAVGARLAASDQDLEVKDAAISCTAACVALLGDVLGARVPPTLQVVPPGTASPPSLFCTPCRRRRRTLRCSHLSGFVACCVRDDGRPSCRAWSGMHQKN